MSGYFLHSNFDLIWIEVIRGRVDSKGITLAFFFKFIIVFIMVKQKSMIAIFLQIF